MTTSTTASPVPPAAPPSYPVHVDADLDPGLSRGLWIVKWFLAIPHYVVLAFLWVAFAVLSVVAFFAILFTGRYPRPIFDFNVGVMRWSWRVSYYSYGVLGTDRYPPFTLAEVPDYPAHLSVDHPEHLSRGLVLVKWWLLAIPHYLIVALFAGGVAYGVSGADDESWISISLIGVLVLVAAVVLLFTGRYPQQVFDLVLGLNRWVLRVAGYVALMTDEYPPFRLDMGGHESATASRRPDSPDSPDSPDGLDSPPAPVAAPHAGPRGWTTGRIVSVVAGSVLVLAGLGLAGAGGTLALVGATDRDDGFVMSPAIGMDGGAWAITSEDARITTEGAPDWVPDRVLGDVRVTAESDSATPLFIGVARSADVSAYLDGVGRDVFREIRDGKAVLEETSGRAPRSAPQDQTFWVASATGTGATLDWEPQDGSWTFVLMRTDGARGVSADVATGAQLPVLDAVVAVLFVLAGLLLLAGALLIAVPVRTVARRER
ncbi:hypothetical protein ASC64_04000 [Nocardioides sp. Root122]|uniref:DUF4389 domain-containing protein n=1 Tax=Nocardioides TaxID=1839 RepID=UPI000702720D|nr:MULTISPECIES: DUF4389 domain-containing protein [Nocardioides]KQV77979.1 hypothetical protein ASC64_04000 [Nocardioides sp. Root122]MCK9825098.1 DUF4389 domain-containing protein [Nocardioides cavernae]